MHPRRHSRSVTPHLVLPGSIRIRPRADGEMCSSLALPPTSGGESGPRRCLRAIVLAATVLLSSCTGLDVRPLDADPPAPFHALLEEIWQFTLRDNPLFATRVGDHRYGSELPAVSLAAQQHRLSAYQGFLDRLRRVDAAALSPEDHLTHAVVIRLIETDVAEQQLESYLTPITQHSGFHVSFAQLPQHVPLETVADYDAYVTRLGAFRRWVDEHIELMRAGIARGHVLPRIVLPTIERTVRDLLVPAAAESLLYAPFRALPRGVPAAERDRLTAAGRRAIDTSVLPGYRALLDFITAEYAPAARSTIAAADLPGGRAFYRHRVRRFTTLDLEPTDVYETGRAEVARIRTEMQAVVDRLGGGSVPAFAERLRAADELHAQSARQLLMEAAYVLKRMDGLLPRLFKTLPRMPYGLRAVPEYVAPKAPAAYYEAPGGDGTRAGVFYLNTHEPRSRPLYTLEALALHEAVPGHHLQIALQQELTDLPPLRRFASFTAFTEGWALYAESLGREVGFYEAPYADFGRLTLEMWRACRLVVDPGIHALGWSRQRAIDFLLEHTALSRLDVETEVDRYITWPGQAVAYKIGELKIRALRTRAEEALGVRFDLREFHRVVLGSGSLPLPLLERNVLRYIERAADREHSADRAA
jgi:uncharacterized protein (DUF885 family)